MNKEATMQNEFVIKTISAYGTHADKVWGPFPNKEAAERHLHENGGIRLPNFPDVWGMETQFGNVTLKIVPLGTIETLPQNCPMKLVATQFELVPAQ